MNAAIKQLDNAFVLISFVSSSDQIVPSLGSSLNCSPNSDPDYTPRFSRKVFVGGLPPDIDEGEHTYIDLKQVR